MKKKLTAIRVRLKDGTSLNFNVDGNIVFRQVGEFLHLGNDGKTLATVVTSEVSFIEYFYSDAGSK